MGTRRDFGRSFLAGLVLAGGASPAAAQQAATWPVRTVRIISTAPPGGASDLLSRTLAQALQERTGQSFVVENRASAAGVVGTDFVAKSAPDGYTWLTTNVGPLAINRALNQRLPYDTRVDFRNITLIGTLPLVLIANPGLPFRTLSEYVAAARAAPGRINFGSGGNGTLHHLTGEMLKLQAGVDIVHVPYRGAQAATQDIIGGRLESMWDSLPSAAPHIRSGAVRALAVSGASRSPAFPEIPTAAEQGMPGLVTTNWFGIAVPAATPDALAAQLYAAIRRVLDTAEVQARFASVGVTPVGEPPDATQAFVLGEMDRWAQVVRQTGVTLD